jgi:ubiquinone/menaquinone biosynthesis C-methylase UbiE
LDKALQMYQWAVAQNEQNQWFCYPLAATYKVLGRTGDAVAAWRQSLRVSAGFGPAVENLRSLGTNDHHKRPIHSHSRAYQWWADVEYEHLFNLISRAGIPRRPARILHIGIGEGGRMDFWLTRFPESEHTGVDIDAHRLPNLSLDRKVLADGEHLPFADQKFDLVLGTHTFHHFANPRIGMLECLRVGRNLVFLEPLTSPVVRFLVKLGVISEYEEGLKVHRFNLKELSSNWFNSAQHRIYQDTYLYRHISSIYPMLDRITSVRAVVLMRAMYKVMDHVLPFLHTKSAVAITIR